MALFAKEAGDPYIFYISDLSNSSSFNGKISRKKAMLEKFGAHVLNDIVHTTSIHW